MDSFFDALGQPHVQLFLRLILGGVLLLAGVTKLFDRAAFRDAVAEYDVLPQTLERPFAAFVPFAEIALGVLLLLGLGTAAAAGIATALFASFAAAIGVNIARDRHFDCHCFGSVRSDDIGWPALSRSLVLVLAALAVAFGANGFGAVDAALAGSTGGLPATAEVIPIVFLAAVVLNVMVLLPEALAFRQTLVRARAGHHGGHA